MTCPASWLVFGGTLRVMRVTEAAQVVPTVAVRAERAEPVDVVDVGRELVASDARTSRVHREVLPSRFRPLRVVTATGRATPRSFGRSATVDAPTAVTQLRAATFVASTSGARADPHVLCPLATKPRRRWPGLQT